MANTMSFSPHDIPSPPPTWNAKEAIASLEAAIAASELDVHDRRPSQLQR
jgi:hypothetical protein